MTNHSIITMLTDFGTSDGFIGVMKGVMYQVCPQAKFVDITHELPPFSIDAAAFLNEWSSRYFTTGTVHLCVVDPGVGTRRRVLLIESDGHYFVGPDNGLFTPIITSDPNARVFHATNQNYWLDQISNTFHGRDIFSPLAAHLANGVLIDKLGDPIDDPVLLKREPIIITDHTIECAVLYIDRFGNLITDLDHPHFLKWCQNNSITHANVSIHWADINIQGISNAYGDKERGELLAIFDGFDKLEISVSGGNAASTTGLGIGDKITLTNKT